MQHHEVRGQERGLGLTRTRRGVVGLAALAVVVLAACVPENTMIADAIHAGRATWGRAPVAASGSLAESARAHSNAMCAARAVTPSADPTAEYDQETATAVDDTVGSAALDPSIADPEERRIAARQALIDSGSGNAMIIDPRWTDFGIGETECDDGRLYLTAAFSQRPTLPASGRYVTHQYGIEQVQKVANIQYGTASNYLGVSTPLMMDLWQPPSAGTPLRPVLVLIHGGGFAGGSRDVYAGAAADFAARGYVVVSIDYRLRPGDCCGPDRVNLAAADAIDDAMEAVRWLRANAATYRIDTTRIGALGSSAGGVVALGLALADDLTPTGPLAAHSPEIHAAVSTGGHLTPGLSFLSLRASQPAVQMFLHEIDPSAGPWIEGAQTCRAVRLSGNTCDLTVVPGEGHTSWITPGSTFWQTEVGPFFWHHLRLGA